MQFYLETERLILRDILVSDIDGMFELDSNADVHKYLGEQPIQTKEEAAQIIAYIHQQYRDLGIGRFAAIEKASGNFIGWSGLKLNTGEKEMLNGHRNFYDIGYRFIPKYWGKGYATESSLAAMKYGFETMNLSIIYGAALTENIASNIILQKIGLQYVNEFSFEDKTAKWYQLTLNEYLRNLLHM